tara:strand:+ start:420 stop:578 length:159 start_codon:yes stop_codon:yes gene_type:complete
MAIEGESNESFRTMPVWKIKIYGDFERKAFRCLPLLDVPKVGGKFVDGGECL